MRLTIILSLTVVASLACKGKDRAAGDSPAKGVAADETSECGKRAALMRERLAGLSQIPNVTITTDLALPELDKGYRSFGDASGFAVELTDDRLAIDGMVAPDREGAAAELLTQMMEASRDTRIVYLIAGADQDAGRIRKLVEELPDGLEARLAVKIPTEGMQLPNKDARLVALHDEIMATEDPSQRATMLATKMKEVIGSKCPQLAEVFAKTATVAPEVRLDHVKTGTADAVEACNCDGVDVDALEALVYMTLFAEETHGWVPLVEGDAATVGELAAAGAGK